MKQFNLDEYLENPSRKVITRDGKNARIICTDAKNNYPIVALIETSNGKERQPCGYKKDGTYVAGEETLLRPLLCAGKARRLDKSIQR